MDTTLRAAMSPGFRNARAFRRAGIAKHVSGTAVRYRFAMQLFEDGYDLRTIQEFLGHKNSKPTKICTYALERGRSGSPKSGSCALRVLAMFLHAATLPRSAAFDSAPIGEYQA
jgi:hypothetical protein